MAETRKLAAILAADVVGYSKLAGADEERTLARLRALWSDLIAPTIAVHNGRVVKRTGDGSLIEFRSVVDAVRCAIEVQNGMVERNAGLPPERRIEFRVGIHLGDVVEESDGDLMGDGVNIAARLEGIADPGGICLSEDAYRQVKSRLDLVVSDLGATQLKNIAEPIRVYALEVGKQARAKPTKFVKRPLFALLGAGLVALIIIAAGAWYFYGSNRQMTTSSNKPAHLSIVVLPFTNLSGDSSQDYFVDGITDNLTTDLSRIRNSFVIARNTAFTFKGKSIDVREIGRELGVRYVLEGSVQRDQNRRIRVNVQLIDAESGNHLWAERFDKPLADLFDTQDEIVARLANMLDAQLITAEARRALRASSPDSMELYFQGMGLFSTGSTRENLSQARELFERALALDPGNVDAEFGVAAINALMAAYYMTDERSERLAKAEAMFARLLLLEPNNPLLHYWMGLVKTQVNEAAQGIAELDRALALNPNLASAHALIGLAKVFVGRAQEAEGHVLQALRLSPRDTAAYLWAQWAGGAKLALGADEEALAWYRRSIEINANNSLSHFYLATTLAQLGRINEARVEVQTGLALDPKFTLARFRSGAQSDNPVWLKQRERFTEGMRKAGVPEG